MLDIKYVLVLDAVGTRCVEILKRYGFEVTVREKISKEVLKVIIPAYDALVVRSATQVTFDVLLAAKNLKFVASADAYYRNIDTIAAETLKIGVINSPCSSVQSVAEFTCGLLFAMSRHLLGVSSNIPAGLPDRSLYSGTVLRGKNLAFLGLGDISKEVIKRVKIFGVMVIGYDPILTERECSEIGVIKMSMTEMWPCADYIVIYTTPFKAACLPITIDMLKLCKKGVKIITIGHIDVASAQNWLRALHDCILTGQVGGAAFDLYNENIGSLFNFPVFKHPSVITTLHQATETEEAIQRGGQEVAEQLVNLVRPGTFTTTISIIVHKSDM